MSAIENKLDAMQADEIDLTKAISGSWNDMMANACIRKILRLRIEIVKFIVAVGDGSKVKKHAKKLQEFHKRITEFESMPLNSKNYKPIFAGVGVLMNEFATWKTQSITNLIDATGINQIENEAEVEVRRVA